MLVQVTVPLKYQLLGSNVSLGDIDAGVTQVLNADGYHGTLGVEVAKFALKTTKGTASDADHFAYLRDFVSHLNCRVGMVEHELQTFYLVIGDDGGSPLTGVGEDLVDERIGDELSFGLLVGMDEDYHRNDYPLYLFATVAPLVIFPLGRDVTFNLKFAESLAYSLLVPYLYEGGYPIFWKRFAVVSPIDWRYKMWT